MIRDNIDFFELQKKYELSKSIEESFIIDGQLVFSCKSDYINGKENFKKHPYFDLEVSNYGRVKKGDVFLEQHNHGKNYLYIQCPCNIKKLITETLTTMYDGSSYTKKNTYCSPVLYEQILENTNKEYVFREQYKLHPYVRIALRKSDNTFFSMEFRDNKKRKYYQIFNDNIFIPLLVYRLVAETWVENENPKLFNEVHHIENNGFKNIPSNLLWVSHEEHKFIEKRRW